MIYFAGRALQLIALVTMPSAIWMAQVYHNERACIEIFAASSAIFILGYLLTRLGARGNAS